MSPHREQSAPNRQQTGQSPTKRPSSDATNEPQPQDGEGAVQRRKRQKIALACEECRSRKVRCDGRRPQCSSCLRRHPNEPKCTYPKEPPKPTSDKRMMQSLQERLALLEGRLGTESVPDASSANRQQYAVPGRPTADMGSQSVTLDSQQMDAQTPNSYTSGQGSIQSRRQQDEVYSPVEMSSYNQEEETVNQQDESSSINAMGLAQLTPEGNTSTSAEFYGKSSVASFVNHIQDRLQPPMNPSQAYNSATTARHPPGRLVAGSLQAGFLDRSSSAIEDSHLPPRALADQLLQLYYTRVHCLYPYLHWPTIMQAYRRLWMSDAEVRNSCQLTGYGLGGPQCSASVFYSSLNVIFALATQFLPKPAQERAERARPFSRRARNLLRLDYLDRGDLALVQALLILAHYLQCTKLPTRCWSVAGVAYRMAQGLGLHLESGNRHVPPLEAEIRRRVWHGCVCLDTVLGMTLGRPCLNSRNSNVPLPSPLEEEKNIVESPQREPQDPDAASTSAFFTQTVKLYQILERILNQVYDPWKENEAGRSAEDGGKDLGRQISCIAELDMELDRFESDIPDVLRKLEDDDGDVSRTSNLLRQCNVLRTRFLHTRILLYRPLFVLLTQKYNNAAKNTGTSTVRTEPPLFNVMAERSSVVCIDSAQALIDHIYKVSGTEETGAPWYNSYYVYHSAMVLTLAEFCPPLRKGLDESKRDRSWKQCREFTSRMLQADPESYRYLRTLQDISRYVDPEASVQDGDTSKLVDDPLQTERQGLIVDHITNPCLDPSSAAWFAEDPPRFDMFAQYGDGDFGLELFRDQDWTLEDCGFSMPMVPTDPKWNQDMSGMNY